MHRISLNICDEADYFALMKLSSISNDCTKSYEKSWIHSTLEFSAFGGPRFRILFLFSFSLCEPCYSEDSIAKFAETFSPSFRIAWSFTITHILHNTCVCVCVCKKSFEKTIQPQNDQSYPIRSYGLNSRRSLDAIAGDVSTPKLWFRRRSAQPPFQPFLTLYSTCIKCID